MRFGSICTDFCAGYPLPDVALIAEVIEHLPHSALPFHYSKVLKGKDFKFKKAMALGKLQV